MQRTRRGKPSQAGLSLLESALILSGVATVLAVFVPAFVRELSIRKTDEAPRELEHLHRALGAYYYREHEIAPGVTATRCLPLSAGPAPNEPSRDARVIHFGDRDVPGHATWQALAFQPARPTRYRYTVIIHATRCGEVPKLGQPLVTLRAEGDLDGDGTYSAYEREAGLDKQGRWAPLGPLRIRAPVE